MNFFRNPWAIVLLIVLVILLFGANKLPGLARNMGKSMRIFKSEVEELRGDEKGSEDEDETVPRSSRQRDDRADDRRPATIASTTPAMTPTVTASGSAPARTTTPTVATEHLDAERVVDSGSGQVTVRTRSAGRKQIRGE